jgi:hypothetical protein
MQLMLMRRSPCPPDQVGSAQFTSVTSNVILAFQASLARCDSADFDGKGHGCFTGGSEAVAIETMTGLLDTGFASVAVIL